jgi:hypothetical protein
MNRYYYKKYKPNIIWEDPITNYRKKLKNELLRLNKFKRILGDEEFFKITDEKFYNELIYKIKRLTPRKW